MPKLNYVNRKSEGLKLGQIVAKDVRKRLKPSATHKDTSPLEIYLDNKALTDDGLAEVARGLEDVLYQNETPDRTTLSILSLTGNALTSRSLAELAPAIRGASEDLQDIDLSSNAIKIATVKDAENWTAFLAALRHCRSLKSLNLSCNDFGRGKAWELFARHFLVHFKDNRLQFEHLADDLDDMEIDSTDMNGVLKTLSLTTPIGKISTNDFEHSYIRGLPSIASIKIDNVGLCDAGALWLSYCVGKYKWVQSRLQSRLVPPPVRASSYLIYSEDKLSNFGLRLLKHAEVVVYDPFATTPRVPDNSPTSRVMDVGQTRRFSNASNYNQPHRRVSNSSDSPEVERHLQLSSHHPHQTVAESMESLQRKLQRTALEDDHGPSNVELWLAAIKMLQYARQLPAWPPIHLETPRMEDENVAPPVEPVDDASWQAQSPPETPKQTYASRLVTDTAEIMGPVVQSFERFEEPIVLKHPRARHENFSFHSDSSSPASKINGSARHAVREAAKHLIKAHHEMIGRLPLGAWKNVMKQLCDPTNALSDSQVENIVRWGRDKNTLASEAECLGKPTAVQIWRVLDGMGCLAYDEQKA